MKKQFTLTLLLISLTAFTYAQGKELDVNEQDDGFPLLIRTPTFKDGGEKGLVKFLASNLKYPKGQHVTSNVYVEFIVDTLGNVKNEKVINGVTKETDAEALRVVRLLKFIPVEQMGKPVAVRHRLFIDFSLVNEK